MLAVKVVPLEPGIRADDDMQEELKLEIELLSSFRHANIVSFVGAIRVAERSEVWLAMELCEMGSMQTVLERLGPLPPDAVGAVMHEVCCGLRYLHAEKHTIHRDIKAANLLFSSDGVVKLADFGVSTATGSTVAQAHTIIGTPHWMSPEVIRGAGYDARADIWSVGPRRVIERHSRRERGAANLSFPHPTPPDQPSLRAGRRWE